MPSVFELSYYISLTLKYSINRRIKAFIRRAFMSLSKGFINARKALSRQHKDFSYHQVNKTDQERNQFEICDNQSPYLLSSMSKPSKSPSTESFRELLDICSDDFYYRSQLATMIVKQQQLIKAFEFYDIGDITASGLRSIVTISDAFVSRILELQKKKNEKSRTVISESVVAATRLMAHIIDTADAIVNQPDQTPEFVADFILNQVNERDLKAFKSLGIFWMPREVQHVIEVDSYQKCLFVHGLHFPIVSHNHRLETATKFAHTLSARELKNVRHDNWFIPFQKYLTSREHPDVSDIEFQVQVTSPYVVTDGALMKNNDIETSRRDIKFYTFCRGQPNGSVLFHCHGGAYMYSHFPSLISYCQYWANDMPGVTIITVQYRLSPEFKYPAALQDIIDSFLWLTSNASKSDRLNTMGFEPCRIILSGDSSGGNLALALLRAIRMIGKPMPSKLVLIYPHTSFDILKPTPSSIQMTIDPFLTASMCMLSVDSYTPFEIPDKISTNTEDPLDRIWYRLESDTVLKRLVEIQKMSIDDPLYCPLAGNFSMFANTELSLMTGEFDPLLDDSILLARKWPRKVNLQIASKVTHAFLAYRNASKETKEANQRILDMLKHMFGLLATDSSNQESPSTYSPSNTSSPSSTLSTPQVSPSISSNSETSEPVNTPTLPESQ